MLMKKSMMLVALGAVVGMTASAKTVALWPLGTDPETDEAYFGSVINAGDDLALGGKTQTRALSLGWNLPPNPDTTIARPRFDPVIRREAFGKDSVDSSGIAASRSTSTELAAALLPNSDFTVEGWVNFGVTPGGGVGNNEWWVVVQANNGSASAGGWILSLRRRNGGHLDWILYQSGGVNDVQLGETMDVYGAEGYDAAEAAFVNRWMHLALVFRYDDPDVSGKSSWTLYADGVKVGSASQNKWSGNVSAKTFELGGRINSNANRARLASFAYWRVSDTCLATNEFLNAGGTGTLVPTTAPSNTKMYWKLGRGVNGGLDTRASVGGVTLHGCLLGESVNLLSSISPSADCAFTGNPPNPTVSLPNGNVGSVRGECSTSFLQAGNLGRELTLTNSFTVEGWVRPRRMTTAVPTGSYVFSTRNSDKAWACQYYARSGKWHLEIFAQDSAGTVICNSEKFQTDLTDWHDWKHLALVYDVEGGDGKGEWRAYLDGTQIGTVVNASKPAGDTSSVNFYLGGRPNSDTVFYGNLDCFRVCRTALAPNQFLNATENAQAATDVLALWPLNAQNGAYFDCADVVGSYNLANKREARQLATVSDEVPVVTNPDPTAGFLGDPTRTDGSTGFRTIGGDNAYLATTRSEVRDLFHSDALTLEGYFRRTAAVNGSWELLFGTTAPEPNSSGFQYITLSGASMQLNFTYRENGFILYADPISHHYDVAFPGTAGAMPLNKWQHVALTFSLQNGTATWKLYLDGELRGTLTGACASWSKPGSFLLGGRPHSSNSFKGSIGNVRISSVALEPGEFLCDENATPAVAPETLAYWPFDSVNGGLDITCRTLPRYDLANIIGLSGNDAMAARRPGLPDASSNFQGDAAANAGSVAFTAGNANAYARYLGDKLDLNVPFTIEGWVKWAHAVPNGQEFLCGTYRYNTSQSGWRLCFDTTGATPKLRIFARGYVPVSVCVDACFDADVSFMEDKWTHLALTYDNHRGNGTWTLFADGKELGTVENEWSPNQGTFSYNLFKFGETGDAAMVGFTGLLDMWRVSRGVRTPASFLFQPPRATYILLR